MHKEFGKLTGVEEARIAIRENLSLPRVVERVKTHRSHGRMLASPVRAPVDSPFMPRSAMDGYAVNSGDTVGASAERPVQFRVTGTVSIGHPPVGEFGKGTCARIPTGAYLPPGLDAVIPVEKAGNSDGSIVVAKAYASGENVDHVGSDFRQGSILIREGSLIDWRRISMLHLLGIGEVDVLRKIVVSVIPTGDEITSRRAQNLIYKTRESNSSGIKAALEETGQFIVHRLPPPPDDADRISLTLDRALRTSDAVITIGGTSAGERDLVHRILEERSQGLLFHGLAVKPGMPTLFCTINHKPVVGLPGPPVSSQMVFYEIFLPELLRHIGLSWIRPTFKAKLADGTRLSPGRLNLIPVELAEERGLVARALPGGSSTMSRLSLANGYIAVQGDSAAIEAGTEVTVLPFGRFAI